MPKVKFWWEDPLSLQRVGLSWSTAFKKKFNAELWNWWLEQNPLDDRVIAAYILEDDKVACFYTVSPRILISPSGQEFKAGLMNAGFTHPEFQGRGYYLEVNRALHVRLKEMGFDCIFGFANHNSHYSYRKYLDWNDVGLLTSFRLTGSSLKNHLKLDPAVTTQSAVLDASSLDEIESCQVAESRYCVKREREYLKWRLLDSPAQSYQLLSIYWQGEPVCFAVFKKYGNSEADLMELFYIPGQTMPREAILGSLATFFLTNGFTALNLWSNLYSDEHLVLEKIGFREDAATTYFGVIDFSGLVGVSDIRKWHYRFLDSDLY